MLGVKENAQSTYETESAIYGRNPTRHKEAHPKKWTHTDGDVVVCCRAVLLSLYIDSVDASLQQTITDRDETCRIVRPTQHPRIFAPTLSWLRADAIAKIM